MTGGRMWSNSSGRYWAMGLAIVFLCGCMTYNAATERSEMIFISPASEAKMGEQIHKEIASQQKILVGTDESKRLEIIGARLARVGDRQDLKPHFYLVESKELNAFTIPGGYVYFYTGLFRKLSSEDQIAAVVAHELAHFYAKHTVKKFQAALGYYTMRNLVFRLITWESPSAQRIAAMGMDGLVNLAMTKYSRQDEYEADKIAIKYLHLAGFDLNGIIQGFEKLDAEGKKDFVPLFLRTHPFVKDRVEAIKKEIPLVREKYN